MSSAILYAAIVAIWACVLVPRWLRRSHEAPAEPDSVPAQEDVADRADVAAPAEPDLPGQPSADDPGAATPSEQDAGAPYPDPVAWEAQADVVFVAIDAEAGHPAAGVPSGHAEAGYTAAEVAGRVEAGYARAGEAAAEAGHGGAGVPAAAAGYGRGEAPAGDPVDRDPQPGHAGGADHRGVAGRAGPGAHTSPAHAHRHAAATAAHPGAERSRVLKARRRGLGLLIAMAVGTIGATFIGLLPVGFLAAPLAVLAIYLLLLRAAAKANADNARKRAHARARGVRARRAPAAHTQAARTSRDLAPDGTPAGSAQPTAEVIDLGTVAACFDQPYDQYADAEARAVGD